jgi:hypothetical protein
MGGTSDAGTAADDAVEAAELHRGAPGDRTQPSTPRREAQPHQEENRGAATDEAGPPSPDRSSTSPHRLTSPGQ